MRKSNCKVIRPSNKSGKIMCIHGVKCKKLKKFLENPNKYICKCPFGHEGYNPCPDKVICRFKDGCNRKNCRFYHSTAVKGKKNSKAPKGVKGATRFDKKTQFNHSEPEYIEGIVPAVAVLKSHLVREEVELEIDKFKAKFKHLHILIIDDDEDEDN